jgi:transcriptional regulator with XRE-family HTH domain
MGSYPLLPDACRMAPLDNYLRTHRKRAGLSQAEASHLVGLKNRIQYARYEQNRSEPPLRIVLACEQVFGVAPAQLFAGVNATVAKGTSKRVQRYKQTLERSSLSGMTPDLRYKLQWVGDCLARVGRTVLYATP